MKFLLLTIMVIIHMEASGQVFSQKLKATDKTDVKVTVTKINKQYYLQTDLANGTSITASQHLALADNASKETVRNVLSIQLKILLPKIVKACPAGEQVEYGNINEFLSYFAEDAAFFFVPDLADTEYKVALGPDNFLKLIHTFDGNYIISEVSSLSAANANDIVTLLYPSNKFSMNEASIDKNSLLLDSLHLLVDLLEKIPFRNKPKLFLVAADPDFKLLLYNSEDNQAISANAIIPHSIGEVFKNNAVSLPVKGKATISAYSIKSGSILHHP